VLDSANGYKEYFADLVGFESRPYWFAVKASNTAGDGIASAISNRVTESCDVGEFLQTHRNLTANITCAPCPEGAYCSGLNHTTVTSLRGNWRVPWSEHGLVFQECPAAESCFGVIISSNGDVSADGESSPNATLSSGTETTDNATAILPGPTRMRVLATSSSEDSSFDLRQRLNFTLDQLHPRLDVAVFNSSQVESCDRGHDGILCT